MGPDSRPSRTAQIVATIRSHFDRPASPDGDAMADVELARSVRTRLPVHRLGPLRRYLLARTRFFDSEVLRAIESRITQIVLVGAGYDGRALRFRTEGVRFFELDHPATQSDKRSRLEALGLAHEDVCFVPVDFGHGAIDSVLAEHGHNRDIPTLFVCEGVTIYLPEGDLQRLLGALRARAAQGSTLAVNFAQRPRPARLLQRAQLAVARLATAAMGERMVTLVTAAEAGALLARSGWRVTQQADPTELFLTADATLEVPAR